MKGISHWLQKAGVLAIAGMVMTASAAPIVIEHDLFDFNGANGSYPSSSLVHSADGAIYGVTQTGGRKGYGEVYKVNRQGQISVLHSFDGTGPGLSPNNLTVGVDGNLYGATDGGLGFLGGLFRLTPGGVISLLHNFSISDGGGVFAPMVAAPSGLLYGIETDAPNGGLAFTIDAKADFRAIAQFDCLTTGCYAGGLAAGPDGNYYGVTMEGGAYGYGTVYQLTPNGALTALYHFSGHADGGYPFAPLTLGPDGNLYGTNSWGGTNGLGVFFSISPQGEFKTITSFATLQNSAGGCVLTLGSDGYFYAVTSRGGTNGTGSVVRLDTQGHFQLLYSFPVGTATSPQSDLVEIRPGAFYGTTYQGGSSGLGSFFQFIVAR